MESKQVPKVVFQACGSGRGWSGLECNELPTHAATRTEPHPQQKSNSTACIGMRSVEMVIEKLPHPDACIVRCVADPVTKERPAGLEVRVVETMVSAGIDDLLDRWSLAAPSDDRARAVLGRCPIVDGTNQNERGCPRAPPCRSARRIECNRRPKPQIDRKRERLEGACLCH